ncbi:MAG: hypothetical protein JXE06_05150 [Coriobacteriia bacterium]|nr:hypothetical protein [Coriobacteriia bacterium]MBN2822528.1 hypothetical protein [Coriobacteriia bacterium]
MNVGHSAPVFSHSVGIFGGLIGLVIWAAVIAVVIALVVHFTRRGRAAHAGHMAAAATATSPVSAVDTHAEDEALRIARERLARGEIDADQYRVIVEALSS